WMNCAGCHAHGGGGMGPPLMDDEWRYGGSMDEIAATILDGRPNGMPSFRGRITEDQAWQLAAFVRALSAQPRQDALPSRAAEPKALEIEITAHQFWWDVRYLNVNPSRVLRTANELHLPAGVTAHIVLRSDDVIHSFWVPNLAGKQDLIPGRTNDISLRPIGTGFYRGQCAEFCGIQHAHMALDVTVEPGAAFTAWWNAQLAPPPAPAAAPAPARLACVPTRACH